MTPKQSATNCVRNTQGQRALLLLCSGAVAGKLHRPWLRICITAPPFAHLLWFLFVSEINMSGR